MDKALRIFIPGEPYRATAQEARIAKHGSHAWRYDTPELKRVRLSLTEELDPYAPAEPMTGPLCMTVTYRYGTHSKSRLDQWKVTKPDTDNLVKMLKDVMTECGFWLDDAQVCLETVGKWWTTPDAAGILIEIGHCRGAGGLEEREELEADHGGADNGQ